MVSQTYATPVRYIRPLTILFCTSLLFLTLHVIDDGLTTGEPAEYGVTLAQFYLYAALIYLIIPPLGLLLARRGRMHGVDLQVIKNFIGEFRDRAPNRRRCKRG